MREEGRGEKAEVRKGKEGRTDEGNEITERI